MATAKKNAAKLATAVAVAADVAAQATETEAATASTADAAAQATAQAEPATPASPTPASADAPREREYVVGTVPIRHNGRVYRVGYSIQLTDAQAERLGGLVALIPEAPKEA